jgi:ABC-type nitrate/sulfonate/bicarbonate transport system permease component
MKMWSLFIPFGGKPGKVWKPIIAAFWTLAFVALWQFYPGALIPRPLATLESLENLYNRGLLADVWTSFSVVARGGFFIAFPVGCVLSYLYTIPFFKPPILFIASLRNMMMNSLVAAFLMMQLGGDELKVLTTAFVILVYFLSSLVQRVDDFPQAKVDHGIAMRMSHWQILWHHYVRGSLHIVCYDFIPCLGMGWSMLSFVEALARNEGGLGDLMLQVDKISSYSGILALAVVSGTLGFVMWYSLRALFRVAFRFATQVAVKS